MIRVGLVVGALGVALLVFVGLGLAGDLFPRKCVKAPCPQPLTLARALFVVSFNAILAGGALLAIGLLREWWRRQGVDGPERRSW